MSFYLIIFAITLGLLAYTIRISESEDALYDIVLPRGFRIECKKDNYVHMLYLIGTAMLCSIVIFVFYGLRVGIGTDYEAYESIFNILHPIDFKTYKEIYSGSYEIGYYFVNRIAPSYRALQFMNYTIMLLCVWTGIFGLREKGIPAFMFFVYLTTEFVFSTNVIRFSYSLCFILVAYIFLLNNKDIGFVLFAILAVLFHRTAILAFGMILMRDWKNVKVNRIRNIILYCGIVIFPLLAGKMFGYILTLDFFAKYLSSYPIEQVTFIKPTFLMHIVPVILPIVVVFREKIFEDRKAEMMFNISVSEVAIRTLAAFNVYLTRLSRIPQMINILFIPYMLYKVEDKRLRRALYIYYIAWYLFYFWYLTVVLDEREMIPYTWIFGSIDIP